MLIDYVKIHRHDIPIFRILDLSENLLSPLQVAQLKRFEDLISEELETSSQVYWYVPSEFVTAT